MALRPQPHVLVLQNFLLRLPLQAWSIQVVGLDPQFWPLHGQRLQALQDMQQDQAEPDPTGLLIFLFIPFFCVYRMFCLFSFLFNSLFPYVVELGDS